MKHSVHVCVPTLQQPGVENRANTEKFGLDAQKYRQLPPLTHAFLKWPFLTDFKKYTHTPPPLRNEILVLWTKNGENPENTRICSALAYSECPREIFLLPLLHSFAIPKSTHAIPVTITLMLQHFLKLSSKCKGVQHFLGQPHNFPTNLLPHFPIFPHFPPLSPIFPSS